MRIQEYDIRHVDGLWQVRLCGRLVGRRPTKLEAVNLAECLAQRAAAGGQRSTVLVADPAGEYSLTFPAFRQSGQLA